MNKPFGAFYKFFNILLVLFLFGMTANMAVGEAQADLTPSQVVQELLITVQNIKKADIDKGILLTPHEIKRNGELSQSLNHLLDIEGISSYALWKYWDEQNAHERKTFMELFTELLTKVAYPNTGKFFKDLTVSIRKEKAKLRLISTGRLKVTNSLGNEVFDLASGGNLEIGGTLTENSDVNTKENLMPVDGKEVLRRLRGLPILTWNRKGDQMRARHLGPMAQDFHAAFGLGPNERRIAPIDVAGAALAAIKEIQREKDVEIAERDVKISELRAEKDAQIAKLQKRLSLLEEKLNRIIQVNTKGELIAAIALER